MAAKPAPTTARLVSTLGGRRALRSHVGSTDELRERLRRGLPFAAVTALGAAYRIDVKRLAAILSIPERTFARRRHERRLRADESDRLVRVARIAALAEEALGGKERAIHWLHRPNRALGLAAPLSLLDTEIGARQVEDVLGRIAHGVYS